jgi:putative lipoic acid-binding regulatory protein
MTEAELEQFRQKLVETTSFPSVYMFKFIIKSDNRNIARVENLFGSESNILTKESEKGKYTSVTARQVVINVDEIIDVYKKASKIEGIIFL